MPKRNWRTAALAGIRKYGPKAARHAARYAAKYASSGSGTTSRNNKRAFTSTGITTDHYDQKLKYRYKRMPRRRRRRYVKAVKFVRHVIGKQLASVKCTTYYGYSMTSTADRQAIHVDLGMTGIPVSSAAIATAATRNACINAAQQVLNISDGANVGNEENQMWKQLSFVVNMTITNYAATTAIIDVYRVVCKKSYANSDYDTPFVDNSGTQNTHFASIGVGKPDWPTAPEGWSSKGITPFQNNEFTSHFKILQVKELQVPAGNSCTLSYRIPKNYKFKLGQFVGKTFIKGLSQGYVLRARTLPSTAEGALVATNIGVETEYNVNVCKIDPNQTEMYFGSKL